MMELNMSFSIRSILTDIYVNMGMSMYGKLTDDEDDDAAYYVGLAFGASFPVFGIVAKTVFNSAKNVVKSGGWLKFHEGVSLGKQAVSHTLSDHVNVDDLDLLGQIASGKSFATRFYNQKIAEDAISKCISENRTDIKKWLRLSGSFEKRLYNTYPENVGGGFRKGNNSFNETSEVFVLLRKTNDNKYVIWTAYPDIR